MEIQLDFAGIETKDALHSYLQQALGLPAYYGKNLDALYDCLTDLSSDITVCLTHFEPLQQVLGGYADSLLQVLQDACTLVQIK